MLLKKERDKPPVLVEIERLRGEVSQALKKLDVIELEVSMLRKAVQDLVAMAREAEHMAAALKLAAIIRKMPEEAKRTMLELMMSNHKDLVEADEK